MCVRDFSELGGLLEGTAMWPQATPDDLDPRHLIGQFGTELLSAARLGTGTTGALGAILGALRTPPKIGQDGMLPTKTVWPLPASCRVSSSPMTMTSVPSASRILSPSSRNPG
jgi:hypothetical protein